MSASMPAEELDAALPPAQERKLALGLLDRLSRSEDLAWLLAAYADLPGTEGHCLVLGALDTAWPAERLMPLLDAVWPDEAKMPDLLLLEELDPETLDALLARGDSLLAPGLDEAGFLRRATPYPLRLIFADTWPHRAWLGQAGCHAFALGEAASLQQAWNQALNTKADWPRRSQPAPPVEAAGHLQHRIRPQLQAAESAFLAGDALTAMRICIELEQRYFADLPLELALGRVPAEAASWTLLAQQLRRYQAAILVQKSS